MAYTRLIGVFLGFAALSVVHPADALASDNDAPGWVELEAQPRMTAALNELTTARDQLLKATPDKGGHRVKALAHVKTAISEVKAGIAYDNAHPGSQTGTESEPVDAQPHMKVALSALEAARKQLTDAERDKAGHRAKAVKETETAINEVEAAVDFDNQH